PADALALDNARAAGTGEPLERRAALGLPGGRRTVVRRPAQPALLHLPAGRGGQPGHRWRPAVPQAHRVPGLGRPGDGAARAGPRDHPAAPRHRRVLAGRHRRVLHLAVPLAGGGAPVNSWAARRAALPAWLRDRRTTEFRRDRRSFAAGVATGGAVAVLGVAIAALALLYTGHPAVQPPATWSVPRAAAPPPRLRPA